MSRLRLPSDYDLLSPTGALALTLGWLSVGLFAATTWWIVAGWGGASVGFLAIAPSPIVAGLCWVPITLGVFAAYRRWPLGRETTSRRVIAYVLAAGATTFALNGLWAAVMTLGGLMDLSAAPTAAFTLGLQWLHVNAAVFAGLVATAHWLEVRRPEEPAETTTEFRSALAAGSNGSRRLLPVEQIDWIAGAGDYCTVHLAGEEHLVDERLKQLERSLDPELFVRIHRSTIVRVERIAEVRSLGRGDCEVRLDNGARLRVARRRRAQLEASLARRLEA